ncbi:MAG: M48 family metallopeptidase [Pseudomonadota bacterium]
MALLRTISVIGSSAGPWMIGYRRSDTAREPLTRVDYGPRRITLLVPDDWSMTRIDTALRARESWFANCVRLADSRQRSIRVAPGAIVPLRGRPHRLSHDGARARIHVEDGHIWIGGARAGAAERAAHWFKEQARRDLRLQVERFASTLKVSVNRLAIRDTRSRWGSCSSSGTLSFSWRAVLAPRPVLLYLAAHEVAHRRHMDHSPAFWHAVGRCMPDWALWRDWLTLNGGELMRYRLP